MIGEELLRPGARVRIQRVDAHNNVQREFRVTVASHRLLGDAVIVKTTTGKMLTLEEWDFKTRGSPYVIREDDDAEEDKDNNKKREQRPKAQSSIDAQVNKYIDDILTDDFNPTQFAQELLGIANRASKILELKHTILKMGIEKIPAEQRKAVSDILLSKFGVSPDETPHETEANIQAPRAGRAGPST